jgi:hypothetical protein
VSDTPTDGAFEAFEPADDDPWGDA